MEHLPQTLPLEGLETSPPEKSEKNIKEGRSKLTSEAKKSGSNRRPNIQWRLTQFVSMSFNCITDLKNLVETTCHGMILSAQPGYV